MEDKAHKAIEMVISYADGHTESFDTFITVVVSAGLIPVGREDDIIIYAAEKDKLETSGIAHVAAGADVIGALVSTFSETLQDILSHASPMVALSIIEAILSARAKTFGSHTEFKTKEFKPGEN